MQAINTSKHVVCSFFSKMCSIGAQCYSLAIITKAFDRQDTALWLLFFHSIFFFSFFDLGLGGCFLQSRLASFYDEKAPSEQQCSFFFEKFFQTLTIYIAAFILLALFSFPLTQLFLCNQKYSSHHVHIVFLIFSFFQFLRFPLNFWTHALMSCQKGYAKSLLEICENCGLILLATTLFILKAPLFSSLIACAVFSFSISLCFFLITIRHLRWRFPKIIFRSLHRNSLTSFKGSFPFWTQNLLSTFLFSFSPFLLNSWTGVHYGSNYILSFKICSLIIGIHFALLSPLMPFYSILSEKMQVDVAQKKLTKSLLLSLGFLLAATIGLLFFIEPLLNFWTKREVSFSFSLLPWMFLYGIINVFSTYLNAIGKVAKQNISLLSGIIIFALFLWVVENPDEKIVCYASSAALIPLLVSNTLEVFSALNVLSKKQLAK